MAITQERMMALITAARQCKDCALTYQRFITTEIKNLPANPELADVMVTLRAIQTLALTNSIPMEAAEILAREEEHFRLMAAKNKRAAAYAKRKRGVPNSELSDTPELSGLKSPTAPKTLDRFKYASLQEIVKPHPSHPNQPPATNWSPDDDLIQHKIKINEAHRAANMPEPYPDVYDGSIPLRDDDCRALGIPVLSDDELF